MAELTIANILEAKRYRGADMPDEVDSLFAKAIVELAKKLDRNGSISPEDFEEFMREVGLTIPSTQTGEARQEVSIFSPGLTPEFTEFLSDQMRDIFEQLNNKTDKKLDAKDALLLEKQIKDKVDSSYIKYLEKLIESKVDKSDLTTTERQLKSKIGKDDLKSLEKKVDSKADKSEITLLAKLIADAATKSEQAYLEKRVEKLVHQNDLSALVKKVDGKASRRQVDHLEDVVSKKMSPADMREMQSEIKALRAQAERQSSDVLYLMKEIKTMCCCLDGKADCKEINNLYREIDKRALEIVQKDLHYIIGRQLNAIREAALSMAAKLDNGDVAGYVADCESKIYPQG